MKSPKNYIAAFCFYLFLSIYSVMFKGADFNLEAHYCFEVAMALFLAYMFQKETPLEVELTVKRASE